jgi:hypothetical protein
MILLIYHVKTCSNHCNLTEAIWDAEVLYTVTRQNPHRLHQAFWFWLFFFWLASNTYVRVWPLSANNRGVSTPHWTRFYHRALTRPFPAITILSTAVRGCRTSLIYRVCEVVDHLCATRYKNGNGVARCLTKGGQRAGTACHCGERM